jgi:hypothetical protein
VGANGKQLPAWGLRRRTVCFSGHNFEFDFLLAAVATPVLVMDFLARFELSIIPAKQQILHEAAPSPSRSVNHIDTGSAAPVFARPRRLDPENHRIPDEEFLALEKAGIIRRSNSPWASPLHLVPKKDRSWRPCGNYRRLNAVTISDRYPLPNMQSLNERMAGCIFFSKIVLVKAFHQIPISEEDIPKTAIATPFGLWEFLFMAFGLRNAAQALQRLKDNILMGLDYVFSFLDDDGVFSKSREQH